MKNRIRDGIYLIIDPSMDRGILMGKLKEVIKEEISAIQIWDNFKPNENPIEFVNDILPLCHAKKIPVLINNQWELLKQTAVDGIHLDKIQDNMQQLKKEVNREIITGLTCSNDLSSVQWAEKNEFDYISFCSLFPSSTANSCELVTFDTVKEAKKITSMSIFLAGGIKPENIELLNELNYSGIAVISGIMSNEKPVEALKKYQQKIKKELK
ncbi:thiamine phosphate synthase [Aquiflexum sp. LQ15W]|uniref:thiamine phosphate synthase n=1 Tax=Cognataquiflexum nitidum TaxID=2922272 RepID=UPI001F1309F2|nr:thiamine phosphate synthase [Cognataquiflexum nitidum]MCH6201928.1 thiamine phosphate synthase [Cognataquiflexum nitidum]